MLIIAFLCTIPQLTHARIVKGKVMCDSDSTAITGAACELRSDTLIITRGVTGQNGYFEFETSANHPITLAVTMVGYAGTEIIIPAGHKTVDVGNIYLNEAKGLGEVTVTANTMTDSQGRTIVFPSASEVKASSTSLSLFSKLPLAGLEVNPITRTLSVDQGSPMILINGVPSSIDDINALHPKDIERIEYSRLTPARYADRGKTGLINITLKRRDDGGQFYGWMRDCPTTGFLDANIRTSYHQGPSQFALYYNPTWRNYQEVYDNERESYIGDDFRVDLEEHDRNPFNYLVNPLTLKYNYSPNTRTLFSATFNASFSSDKSRNLGSTIDSELGEYTNVNKSQGRQFSPSLDLFLRHDFDDSNSIEVQTVGTLLGNKYRRNNTYIFGNGKEETYQMDVDNHRRSLITEISYNHTFSQNTSLSGGVQNTVSHSRNTYLTSDYEPILTENNNYIYVRLGQRIQKLYLSLSTGAKLFWVKNDLNKRNFVRNLTTIQANWTINSTWNMVAAFQYSPNIPSLSSLTDYPQQTSPYLISNGNPDLKVSEWFTYQFMPSYRYKKFSSSLLLTYRNVRNNVISDIVYIGNREFLSVSVNSHKYRNAVGTLNLQLSDVSGFGGNVNFQVNHYQTAGDGWEHKLTSFSGNMSVWWNKGPVTFTYWRKFPGKYLSGHYVRRDENGDMLSFSYKPDKHWTIDTQWMYMFERKGTKYPSWNYSSTNPGVTERYIKNNANMLVLSVSYSADFGSIFRTARRSLNNSDNGSSLLRM